MNKSDILFATSQQSELDTALKLTLDTAAGLGEGLAVSTAIGEGLGEGEGVTLQVGFWQGVSNTGTGEGHSIK